jgi:hypothetical protein
MLTFTPFADAQDALRARRRYLVHAEGQLPELTFKRLEALFDSPSNVDQVCRGAELLYAHRDELDDEGRKIVAQLASFAATNFWHGMADKNRGGRIAQAMMRDSGGEAAAGQAPYGDPADDPAPEAQYVGEPTPVPGA